MTEYRLQRREKTARPYVIGNTTYPYITDRWVDIALCAERKPLEDYMEKCVPFKDYRIIMIDK